MWERVASFWMEPLHTTVDVMISTISRGEVLHEDERRNQQSQIVSHGMESTNNDDRDAGSVRYISARELLLDYAESDCRQV